jgi:hypothetical protein
MHIFIAHEGLFASKLAPTFDRISNVGASLLANAFLNVTHKKTALTGRRFSCPQRTP